MNRRDRILAPVLLSLWDVAVRVREDTDMQRRFFRLCVAASALIAAVGCEVLKSENPTSPSVAGPIPGVNITAPKLLEPSAGLSIRFPDQPITLLFENSSTSGQRTISYTVEVAIDEAFTNRVYSRPGLEPGPNGQTALKLPDALASDRTYYWRVWALDGANSGPYSAVSPFSIVPSSALKAPVPLAPVGGVTIATLVPELRALNAVRSGPIGSVSYTFEISDNEAFTAKAATATVAEQALETRVKFSQALIQGGRYFWRLRAYDSTATSPWSVTETFKTPGKAGPVPGPSAPRTIGIDEAASIIRFIYEDNGYHIGSGSSRDLRNLYLERAVAALHFGHSRYNPQGSDSNWCIKNAGAGRPQSDDVIVRCDTRDAWDLIAGIGADGYSWHIDYLGSLTSDQIVYAPSVSALNDLPR